MFNKIRERIRAAAEKKALSVIVNKIQKNVSMNSNKSWKTTVAGWLTGLVPIVYALIDAYNSGQFTGKSTAAVAVGVGMIVFGHLSKDADKTGLPVEDKKSAI